MSNTPLEQNGIDLDSVLEKVNALPQAGITPTGSITLTEEKSYDVTEKAAAVVDMSATRARLAEAITAKGVDTLPDSSFDAMIANVGLISGGGLPTSVSKLTGGNFTVPINTRANAYNIPHDLGVQPVGFAIWVDNIPGDNTVVLGWAARLNKQFAWRMSIGGQAVSNNATAWIETIFGIEAINLSDTQEYKANTTYHWLAWA